MNDIMIRLIMIKLQELKIKFSSWISSRAALTTRLGHLATFQMTCVSGKSIMETTIRRLKYQGTKYCRNYFKKKAFQ